MILGRRSLIGGILAFACAPAIVRASSIMPIKPMVFEPVYEPLEAAMRAAFEHGGCPQILMIPSSNIAWLKIWMEGENFSLTDRPRKMTLTKYT